MRKVTMHTIKLVMFEIEGQQMVNSRLRDGNTIQGAKDIKTLR